MPNLTEEEVIKKLNTLTFHDPDGENLKKHRKAFEKEAKEYYNDLKPSRRW